MMTSVYGDTGCSSCCKIFQNRTAMGCKLCAYITVKEKGLL